MGVFIHSLPISEKNKFKMKPFLANIIIRTSLKLKDKKKYPKENLSEYKLAKEYQQFVISLKRNFKNLILIIIGIFSASFGFKGFLLTNNFIVMNSIKDIKGGMIKKRSLKH